MSRRPTCALLLDYYGGEYQIGLMQGAEDAAIRCDQNLLVAVGRWLDAPKVIDSIQNDVFRHLGKPGVDAVIVASGCLSHYVSPARMAEFCASFSPLPVASISLQVADVPSIVVDNRRSQKQVVDHFIEVHRAQRIAYLRGPSTSFEAGERFDGYRQSLREHGIEYRPELVLEGNFWIDSGTRLAHQLLDGQVPFDALIAANDYMALGALDVLKARGRRVPEDVRVAGFDDVPVARMASPSLTTVRQPLHRMGALAIDLVNAQIAERDVPLVTSLEVELVRRQSCGCHTAPLSLDRFRSDGSCARLDPAILEASVAGLRRTLLDAINVTSEQWPDVVDALLNALLAEINGHSGTFERVLTENLAMFQTRVDLLEQFYGLMSTLRTGVLGLFPNSPVIQELCYGSVLLIAEAMNRVQMRALLEQDATAVNLRASVERLSTALSTAALGEALGAILPSTAIGSACLSLYEDGSSERLRAFAVTGGSHANELLSRRFEARELAPECFFPSDHRHSFVLLPLSHGEVLYGQALFQVGDQRSVYAMLREQIGALLKAASLHRAVVEETSRRERAERERLERDTEIAQQIQTALLPERLEVPGLTFSASMRPAATVGGDYYDVIVVEGGCYIGVGDVTGHGLLSGIVMMMIQSMITAAVRANPRQSPATILPVVNRALYDNVRHRLRGNDHATLTLIRYERSGRLLFSGAHDEPLIWRKRTGKCEVVQPPGFWLGAVEDIEAMTQDLEVNIEDGDLLVLYTDGVTEAMNATHEQFGFARLKSLVERRASDGPDALRQGILDAIDEWSTAQIDDVTLLIARFDAEKP
jgi:DNA-binding LacI/PurR family transcriptional regulator/serine phosphatase RsbU (regulator of sigma subunit)